MLDTLCACACARVRVRATSCVLIHQPSIHISMTYLATVTNEQDRYDRQHSTHAQYFAWGVSSF